MWFIFKLKPCMCLTSRAFLSTREAGKVNSGSFLGGDGLYNMFIRYCVAKVSIKDADITKHCS